ncbi:hypothetical protein ABK249_18370 [Neorhizobium sp. Rsf11]|uniref:Uncharacterized protein n=2 Tax=Rhizobium/Agrobacterium group TaxID=227290 RepID=A0ABV0M4U9_9HYPH
MELAREGLLLLKALLTGALKVRVSLERRRPDPSRLSRPVMLKDFSPSAPRHDPPMTRGLGDIAIKEKHDYKTHDIVMWAAGLREALLEVFVARWLLLAMIAQSRISLP